MKKREGSAERERERERERGADKEKVLKGVVVVKLPLLK